MSVAGIARSGVVAAPVAAHAWVSERVQKIVLVVAREITKRGFVAADAFAIEIGEGIEKVSLFVVGISGQDKIDVAIDESFFGARRVGGRDDEVAENNERFVLVIVEEERFPVGRGKVFGDRKSTRLNSSHPS